MEDGNGLRGNDNAPLGRSLSRGHGETIPASRPASEIRVGFGTAALGTINMNYDKHR